MIPPETINLDFSPLFESLVQVEGHLDSAIPISRNTDEREMLSEFLRTLRKSREELETIGPAAVIESRKRYSAAISDLEKVGKEKDELLNRITKLRSKAMEALAEAKIKAAEKSKLPKVEIPRPKFRRPEKSAQLKLTPGDDLRDWLIPPPAASEPVVPRTHGNIWDNWRIAARQEPTTSKELGNQEDREDEEPE
jgi:hypothetical protein